jgi:hypothetical protein
MSDETHLAEKPREGESWREMIERQQKEQSNQGGYLKGLMRSLPDEQKDKPPSRGELQTPLMAEGQEVSFQDFLKDAARYGRDDNDRGLSR